MEPTELTGAPNIYCGVLLVMLVVFYAVSKNISLREKIGRLLVTGFVLVSLCLLYTSQVKNGCGYGVRLDMDEWLSGQERLSVIEKF